MENTAEIKCPKCNTVQSEDINELASGTGEMDGSFPYICDKCNKTFTVEYEYKPFIKTY